MLTEAQTRVEVNAVASAELRQFDAQIRDLELMCRAHVGVDELSEPEFDLIAFEINETADQAKDVIIKLMDNGVGPDVIESAQVLLRNKVKQSIQPLEDDSLKTSSGELVKITNLNVHRFFELLLEFDIELERGHDPDKLQAAYLAARHSDAGLLHRDLQGVVDAKAATHPELGRPNYEPTPTTLEYNLQPDVVVALGKVLKKSGKKADWLSATTLTQYNQQVSDYDEAGVHRPPKKLTADRIKNLTELRDALEDLRDEQNSVSTNLYTAGFEPLDRTIGAEKQDQILINTINIILEKNSRLGEEKEVEQVLKGWRQMVDRTRVEGLTITSYLQSVQRKLSGGDTDFTQELANLDYLLEQLDVYRLNIPAVKYADPSGTFNGKVADAKTAYLTELEAKINEVKGKLGVSKPEANVTGPSPSYYHALNKLMNFATGGWSSNKLFVLGVGSNETTWPKEMKEAQKEYTEWENRPDIKGTVLEQVGKAVIGMWDYAYYTRKGKDDGVEHDLNKIDDTIHAKEIRAVISHYDLKKTTWMMRGIAMRMLLGFNPTTGAKDSKYAYGDDAGYVNNKDTFQTELQKHLLLKLYGAPVDAQGNAIPYTNDVFEEYKRRFIRDHHIENAAGYEALMGFMWQFNLTGNFMDEVYAAKSYGASSKGHNTKPIEGEESGKKAPSHTLDIIAGAIYAALNPLVKTDHTIMNLALIPESALNLALERVGLASSDIHHKLLHEQHLIEKYMRALYGEDVAHDLFGILPYLDPAEHPGGPDYPMPEEYFPTLFASILEYGLSTPTRYFNVEAKGFANITQILNKPMKNDLSIHEAELLIGAFVKEGLGLAKLAKDGFKREVMVALGKYYAARVFHNLDYGTKGPFFPHSIRFGGDPRIRSIQKLRAKVVHSMADAGGATTLKSLDSDPLEALLFRADFAAIFGVQVPIIERTAQGEREHSVQGIVDMIAREDARINSMPDGAAKEAAQKQRNSFIKDQLKLGKPVFGDIPDYLYAVYDRAAVEDYAVEIMHEESSESSIYDRVANIRAVWVGRFQKYGLAKWVEPPYLAKDHAASGDKPTDKKH